MRANASVSTGFTGMIFMTVRIAAWRTCSTQSQNGTSHEIPILTFRFAACWQGFHQPTIKNSFSVAMEPSAVVYSKR